MINEQELLSLLADLESDRVERTASTANTDKFAEAMKVLGYVNKYGRGILRAQDALRKNGSPPAAFNFDPNYVLVTVQSKP
jgi:ATP-dependent DNA helicase RecG